MELGEAIRARRSELGLTLDGLAERAGVSRAMLSEIEREVKTPTIRVLSQIATGLATTVGQLIGETTPQDEPRANVVRLTERQTTVEPRTGVVSQALATSALGNTIAIRWYIIPPGQQASIPTAPPVAAIHLTIVRGTLHCRLGVQELTLAEGDSCSFAADHPHTLHNPSTEACHCFLVGASAPQAG